MAHFGVRYVDYGTDLKVVEKAVKEETSGPGQLLGYRSMHKKLQEHHQTHTRQNIYCFLFRLLTKSKTAMENLLLPFDLHALHASHTGWRIVCKAYTCET